MILEMDENEDYGTVIDDDEVIPFTAEKQRELMQHIKRQALWTINHPPPDEEEIRRKIDTPGTSMNHCNPPAIRVEPRQKTINPQPRVREYVQVSEEVKPVLRASYTISPLNTRAERIDRNNGSMLTRTNYLNYSRRTLFITTSDNIQIPIEPFRLPADVDRNYEGFIEIRHETLMVGPEGYKDLKSVVLSEQREVLTAEMNDLRLAIRAAEANPRTLEDMLQNGVVVARTWRISLNDINKEERVYVDHLGIYISGKSRVANLAYGSGYLDRLNHSVPEEASGFCLTVVDNEDTAGKRYMYSAGQIMTFVPIKNTELRSGVYICSKSGLQKQLTEYLTFEEATEKIKLYDNKADAATNGDPKHYYTKHSQERNEEMNILKHEFEKELMQLRNQQEQERADREREMAEFKKMHEQSAAQIRNDFEKEKLDIKLAHEREMNALKRELLRQEEMHKEEDRKRQLSVEEENRKRKKKQEKEDRKLAKKRAREERAYKLQLEEEERKRVQRMQEEERTRLQRLEEEERERKKRLEEEDRQRKQRQEEEDRQRKQRQEEEDRQRKAFFEHHAHEHAKRLEDEENRRRQYQENTRWMREQDRMIKQDLYEDRSYRRKDSSEFLKQIPLYVTAGLAAFTAYTTYQSSKTNKSIYDSAIIDI